MIAITGATGHLGKLVIEHLLKRNVNPNTIVAVVRDATKAKDLATKGITVREANYNSEETLKKAFSGVDKLLLISGSEVGQRISQHQNAISAAKANHVKQILYTSILKADISRMQLAVEHLATENAIRASETPFVILRNGWYIENYTEQISTFLQFGAIAGSAGQGQVSAATRSDYAEAAAVSLLSDAKENRIYELAGAPFTLSELAQVISEFSGKKVVYSDMPEKNYADLLIQAQLPPAFAHILADSDVGITRGELFSESKDLEKLIGHKPTPLAEVVKTILKK
jgi:NAD(P)H dehydrogenase (quinone)